MMMHDIIAIMILAACLLVAFTALYLTTVKSNKILFYDNSKIKAVYPLVGAGSSRKDKKIANASILGTDFYVNGEDRGGEEKGKELYESESYTKMLVDGNSMQEFGIQNGDIVFVNQQLEKEKLSEKTKSIIAFRVPEEKLNEIIERNHRIFLVFPMKQKIERKIEYQLRKFIDFIDYDVFQNKADFQKWIEKHPNLNDKKLMDKYDEEGTKDKIEECRKNNNSRLVLSETRRRGDKWYHITKSVYYSLHPENRLFGKVEYKIPKERVYVLNKV